MSDMEKKLTEETEMPKEKKKKKKVLVILLPMLAVFLALVIAVVAFVAHKFSLIDFDENESTTINPTQEFIDDDNIDFAEMDDATGNDFREILKNWATNGGEKMSNRDIINILLIGSDASAEEEGRANITEKGNTDVMMLVSINQVDKKIKLISFMRDSYTYMDQFDRYAKLNAACANGGPAYLVETIENDYKIEIDGYAMVDFDSFTQVIDVLGGVYVDVPEYVAKFLSSEKNGVYFPRGENVLLNGEEALRFSRVRKTDANGDVSRVARQRQVVNALIEKAKNATLSEINEVADVMLANVRTNISKKSIISYASKAVTEGWANYEITEVTMPTPDTRYGYSSKATAWIWVVDYPLAAQKTQLEIYGETNINLEEGNRKTAVTVIGGYVSKKTADN